MHFALDGLTSVLVTLQPTLAVRIAAAPATLGLIVAVALSTASLLQPVAARLAGRFGDPAVAAAGAVLAAIGYGSVPATTTVPLTVAAVTLGGIGSALFHPAAGALVARTVQPGREALPIAAFSAVGTAGTAIVPFAVLTATKPLGWAAALPEAAALVGLTLVTRARVFRPVPTPATARAPLHADVGPSGRHLRLAVTAAALIALASVTVGASAAVLMAARHGDSHPAVAWIVAAFSASGAVGGMALAVWARRVGVRRVLLVAVAAGTVAASAFPFLAGPPAFAAVVVAGVGLTGSLPLLIGLAKRPGEQSAAGAVGRILGLGGGLGGAGYAAVGIVQGVVGYGPTLTGTVALAGAGVLAAAWFLCRSVDPSTCSVALRSATATCGCGSCGCA
jgi:FSR family fosmidomycin resistance protein-like MFS transporter